MKSSVRERLTVISKSGRGLAVTVSRPRVLFKAFDGLHVQDAASGDAEELFRIQFVRQDVQGGVHDVFPAIESGQDRIFPL